MIDLQYFKDRVSEFPEHGISSAKLESVKLYELIQAIEEAKILIEGHSDPDDTRFDEWLSKYFGGRDE